MIRRIHALLELRSGASGAGANGGGIVRNSMLKGVSMSKRVTAALLALALALSFTACGGKEEEEEEAAAPKAAKSTASAAAPAAGGATITGKVAFTGTAPAKEQIKMDADAFCKGAHAEPVYTQEVVVNGNGTLQWVLVYVKEGVAGNYPPPPAPVTLDQK